MRRGKSLLMTSTMGALLGLLAWTASASEIGVCPPYSKTFGPEDAPEAILGFIAELNARPGGGTLILEAGDYGNLGDISITGVLCLQGRSATNERVFFDGQFAVGSGAHLTLSSLTRQAWTSHSDGLTVTVNHGGVLWSDRCDLSRLVNDGAAFLRDVWFVDSKGWSTTCQAIHNTGFLLMDRGDLSKGDCWGLVNDGGHAQLQQVFVWENGYADNFDYWGGGILNTGVVKIVESTVTGNTGNGGIHNDGGVVEIFGSIVAENNGGGPADPGPYDCRGPISDLGYNVFGLGQAGLCIVTDSTSTAADPVLSSDRYPEVGSYYQPARPGPGLGSPAIDRVPLDRCKPTDALGRPRTDGNGDGIVACDAGALEFSGQGVVIKSPPFTRDYGLVDLETDTALYVVFMSSAAFDPADVVVESVILGDTGAVPRGYGYVDRNGDGILDLRLRYKLKDVPLVCGEQVLAVSATTRSGESVGGELKLEVTGCTF